MMVENPHNSWEIRLAKALGLLHISAPRNRMRG